MLKSLNVLFLLIAKTGKRMIGCIILCCMVSIVATAQNKVIAEISNFKNDKGVCRACLFNSPTSFKGESGEPFRCQTVPVKNRTSEAIFNVPAGTYALFVFHDANSNNKIDKNFLGIPKEGYGASKNKLPFASAPTYDDNKFLVAERSGVRLQVKLRNL